MFQVVEMLSLASNELIFFKTSKMTFCYKRISPSDAGNRSTVHFKIQFLTDGV